MTHAACGFITATASNFSTQSQLNIPKDALTPSLQTRHIFFPTAASPSCSGSGINSTASFGTLFFRVTNASVQITDLTSSPFPQKNPALFQAPGLSSKIIFYG
jgi:hypothetical protein